jgi:putative transcriptional regulator
VSILRGIMMSISYDKLWDILRERGLSRTELVHMAKISTNAMAKLGKNEDVRVQILIKICLVLNCKIDDIMEYGVDLK